MGLPLLQIALDNQNIPDAITTIQQLGDVVDVVEVGTILCLQEGKAAIEVMRALYPDKCILADTKCADAGKTVAQNCKDAGANWMTVICSATLPTMVAARKVMDDLQVELYGDWTFEQAQQWLDNDIQQVVYHQSRDALLAGGSWSDADLDKIRRLIEMGFKVSVTGGLELDTIEKFKGLDVYAFIAGRSLREADSPHQEALDFKAEIQRVFG
ncbi:3-keto-L-gulonate-6-phosphate decarboxylase UlaD [Staphylococcus delphini]|uniref:3-keto-L-gulonate-6-phosphate decarboxylase UlaD n=1 Tax=Staphylococcus delphini TaxID=53344 RepID=UPI0021D28A32|nr:3-keto-L-gulonate-6-phosphate decarboxylase UlaD [Staphylococcus delphini]UXS30235.1 3-keto-L-gulonate-6-phosphate decarboxylase UlaD [Staphylococcus delphini]UXS37906.1 3-keto-L-gulonate-6-phosphate decarboxylase UlaD [Staphylococcus delphini]UXS45385.1 3-keto-L-gulonate-6-phosphate decarboxylase UlaD [Staphylococcus delphini]UXV46007.1 3-keto-L-gulonate-6-phosphate decarboxylase UlaD [Staphylococcus delphini]